VNRRVEMDRSWMIYHVFTGISARDGSVLTHIGRSAATHGMLSLNLRNVKRRKDRKPAPDWLRPLLDQRVDHDIGLSQPLPKFR